MSRQVPLHQSDLTRYAKALRAAKVSEYRVVVRPDGTHEIIVGVKADASDEANDWD